MNRIMPSTRTANLKHVLSTALVFVVASLPGLLSADETDFRTWGDATGQFQVEAKFLSFKDGKVELEKRGGNVISVPIEKLREEDQEWVKKRLANPAFEPPDVDFGFGDAKAGAGNANVGAGDAKAEDGNPAQRGRIDVGQLRPNAAFSLELPALGTRDYLGGGSPVMSVRLPDNYSPDQPHPVLLQLPYYEFSPDEERGRRISDQYGLLHRWSRIFDNKNFILVCVDYSYQRSVITVSGGKAVLTTAAKPIDSISGTNSGPSNAIEALSKLGKVTTIDKKTIVLSCGPNNMAYARRDKWEPQHTKRLGIYCAFVAMDQYLVSPAVVRRRPVLRFILSGRNANAEAAEPAGSGRGQLTTMVLNGGFLESFGPKDEQIRSWFYSTLPAFSEYYSMSQTIEKIDDPARRLAVQRKLAECWLDLPGVSEAKQAVAAADAP